MREVCIAVCDLRAILGAVITDRETKFRKFRNAEYSDFSAASGHMRGGIVGRSGTTSTRSCDPSADPDWSNGKSLEAEYVM